MDNVTPLGVSRRGRIVWGDEDGHRDFSPRVQLIASRIAGVVLIVFGLVALLLATGVIPAAPWAPLHETPPAQPVEQGRTVNV